MLYPNKCILIMNSFQQLLCIDGVNAIALIEIITCSRNVINMFYYFFFLFIVIFFYFILLNHVFYFCIICLYRIYIFFKYHVKSTKKKKYVFITPFNRNWKYVTIIRSWIKSIYFFFKKRLLYNRHNCDPFHFFLNPILNKCFVLNLRVDNNMNADFFGEFSLLITWIKLWVSNPMNLINWSIEKIALFWILYAHWFDIRLGWENVRVIWKISNNA